MSRPPTSEKAARFTESVIREMSRLIALHHPADGINLAQGFPDFAAPQAIKDAACAAIQADINQYAVTWGSPSMRQAVAVKANRFYDMDVDADRHVTVCCGATETIVATMLAVCDPGDEVVIFEPFYENYGPDCIVAGAVPRYVTLHAPDWHIDMDELRSAFSSRTRAVVINTPHNPTGKVFSRAELEAIAALCIEFDALAITDEIYEHIVYAGEHIPIATLPGMRDRTITISGLSKTFAVTGWRLGYAIASEEISNAIRKMHDFLTVGAAAPLQAAAAVALAFDDAYYRDMLDGYRGRRQYMLETLDLCELPYSPPDGAYYVTASIEKFGLDDVAFTSRLITELGVAVVPGSSFHAAPGGGSQMVRFAFPKRPETLAGARERLLSLHKWAPGVGAAT